MTRARIAAAHPARHIIAVVVVAMATVLGLTDPAHAYPQPIEPAPGTAGVSPEPATGALASGPTVATILGIVAIALVAGALVILAARAARHRRQGQPAGLHA